MTTEGDAPRPDDPYSRCDYRRLIAWPERIEREAPFLLSAFGAERRLGREEGEPGRGRGERRLLDLGCGTGEHARYLAAQGFAVVGVDASPSMLAAAREEEAPGVNWVEGDLGRLGELDLGAGGQARAGAPRDRFTGAYCLGNALPHLAPDALDGLFGGLARLLAPGAPLLLQLLNYERVFRGGVRHLPVNVRPDPEAGAEGGEIVFLRLMAPQPDGTVVFNPTTLRWRPGAEPPLEVARTRNVHLHGWRRPALEAALEHHGFTAPEAFGGMVRESFQELESQDLVLLSRRRA